MSAAEFLFGKGRREYQVAGVFTINHSRRTPNNRKIEPEKVRELVWAAYQKQPWVDDEFPSPRDYHITVEESGSTIKARILLYDRLRQAQLRPFARYISSIGHSLCHGELEYWSMYYEVETTQFLGFGVWG